MELTDASILVTGGTGSSGTRFVETVLARPRPRRLVVFSRDELKQSEMQGRLRHPALRFFIGDVRDRERLVRAMHDIETLIPHFLNVSWGPVVPRGEARLRAQVSAALRRKDIDRALEAFRKVGKKMGILP